jgi:hypothetical protein
MNTWIPLRLCPALSFRNPRVSGLTLAALLAIFVSPAFAANPPPAAPTGLIATAGGDDVSLTWTASVDAKSYRVYRGTSSNGESSLPLIECDRRDTHFTDRAVHPGQTYYYVVRAVNRGNDSSPSNEVKATPYKNHETVGGGTVDSPAIGPAPRYGVEGGGAVLVKNWNFGQKGTIKSYADMNANFFYHDQFGTIGNGTNYGAITIAPDDANAINTEAYGRQPHEGGLLPGELANPVSITVPNFGFELPYLGPPTNFDGNAPYQYNPAGGGWTFEGTSGIAVRGSSLWAYYNPEGDQLAFLEGKSGSPLGKMSQTLNFPAAGMYAITFYLGKHFGDTQPVQITVDGVAVGAPMLATTVDWNKATFTSESFTIATPGNHTVAFAATDASADNLTFIDAVTIDEVGPPVPVPVVRKFTEKSLKTFIVPLGGATTVQASSHNMGCGSFMAQFPLPAGGSHLTQDIIWETRVRYDPPPYFWFAIWAAGEKWDGGAEEDVVESFGFDNGGGFTNYHGQYWHSNSVGGSDDDNYGSWPDSMAAHGITHFKAAEYHTWTWLYRKDNTYSVFLDGKEVQTGALNWTLSGTPAGEPLKLYFLFDAGLGHVSISSVNQPLPATELKGKHFEWDYSRVYLKP